MQMTSFFMKHSRSLLQILAVCGLIFVVSFSSLAQYKGAPVQKDRLIKALRSKQLQTEDIVAVIKANGVDFKLTPEIRKALIAAGARPEVIQAVANNLRPQSNSELLYAQKDIIIPYPLITPPKLDYDDLLEKAVFSFEERRNSEEAVRYLEEAVRLKPTDAKAYQMLGFINLYGLSDLENTRKYMRASMSNGGSAVFRVYHDDNGNFTGRCSGSLYISPDKIRFESDDNIHTFETSTANIEKTETKTESSLVWKKHPIFNVYLRFGKEKAKFRFAPISGKLEESNMAEFLISELQLKGL